MNRAHFDMESWAQERRVLSRRDALQRGFGGLAGAALTWWVSARARAADGKLTKAAVDYVEAGNVPGRDCDDCVQFVPGANARAPASCRIVEGEISPHGHCVAFAPRPRV